MTVGFTTNATQPGSPNMACRELLRHTNTPKTTSQLGLWSSSTCNKGRNYRLITWYRYLSYSITSYPRLSLRRQTENRSLRRIWVMHPGSKSDQLIRQKTEFLLNCSILWRLASLLHHQIHCHGCMGGNVRSISDQMWVGGTLWCHDRSSQLPLTFTYCFRSQILVFVVSVTSKVNMEALKHSDSYSFFSVG